ncbi:MAG TPA: hypothetical protein VMG36_03790 [Thermoplasmata archaeon]|nr:hypothetical protein [Thermoplasmata archaeon]
MQRETTFRIGGGIAVALGVALAAGLAWAGAGLDYFGAWLAAGLSVLFGAFFFHVAADERRYRAEYLRAVAEGRPPPGEPPV